MGGRLWSYVFCGWADRGSCVFMVYTEGSSCFFLCFRIMNYAYRAGMGKNEISVAPIAMVGALTFFIAPIQSHTATDSWQRPDFICACRFTRREVPNRLSLVSGAGGMRAQPNRHPCKWQTKQTSATKTKFSASFFPLTLHPNTANGGGGFNFTD